MVTRAFKAGYKYPYLNWRETPSYVRDAWFNIFKEAFQARSRDMAADLGEVYNDEIDEQILNDNQIFLDASGGFKKGQVFGLGTAAKLYYDTPSEARTTPKASSYVLGIVTQIENAANEKLDAFDKTMEERLKQQEEAHKKAQELVHQQLIYFQTLVQNLSRTARIHLFLVTTLTMIAPEKVMVMEVVWVIRRLSLDFET